MDIYDAVGPLHPEVREEAEHHRELQLLAQELGYRQAQQNGCILTAEEYVNVMQKMDTLDKNYMDKLELVEDQPPAVVWPIYSRWFTERKQYEEMIAA